MAIFEVTGHTGVAISMSEPTPEVVRGLVLAAWAVVVDPNVTAARVAPPINPCLTKALVVTDKDHVSNESRLCADHA